VSTLSLLLCLLWNHKGGDNGDNGDKDQNSLESIAIPVILLSS